MPFISRLSAIGWIGMGRLLFATVVIMLESVFRVLLLLVPTRLSHFASVKLNFYFPSGRAIWGDDASEHVTMDMSTQELIAYFGYPVEEHMVCTEDGYCLSLQRIPHSKHVSNATAVPRPAVLLVHGLMQSSEAWVCWNESLAFLLSDSSYDVWLGNVRGNKYSCRHVSLKPFESKFWDFSLDEMAMFDLPCMIDFILQHTGNEKLSYIGFSQGTGAALACFSLLPRVASKISIFVALSPAAKAKGLRKGMLQTFINMAPESLFLLLGTRAVLTISLFWRSVLHRRLFARVIDRSCETLFGWEMRNIGPIQRKTLLYPHLFSYASVKTVAHWMQIAACDRFQQYDENQSFGKGYRGILPQGYPVCQIRCKMAMFYGGSDDLTDIQWLLGQLSPDTMRVNVEGYEHLDLIWAEDAHERVFPKVLAVLQGVHEQAREPGKDTANTVPAVA